MDTYHRRRLTAAAIAGLTCSALVTGAIASLGAERDVPTSPVLPRPAATAPDAVDGAWEQAARTDATGRGEEQEQEQR